MSSTKIDIEFYQERDKYKNKFTRALFFLVGDTFSLILAAMAAYFILSPFVSPGRAFPIEHAVLLIVSVLLGMAITRMYLTSWGYTSLRDLMRLVLGIVVGGCISLGLSKMMLVTQAYTEAFNVILLINAVLFIGGFRISKRVFSGLTGSRKIKKKNTIIFGGESEGEQILREILTKHRWNLSVNAI